MNAPRIKHLLTIAFVILLTACGSEQKSTRYDQFPELSLEQCRAKLATFGVVAAPTSLGERGSCGVATPVTLGATSVAEFSPPLKTSCAMAAAWLGFEREVDRILREHMRVGLAQTLHFGSFSCRRMTGNGRRMSLHSSARAIDISGFELRNGERISVLDDWRQGDKGRALRDISRAACERFAVVLTPAHDAAHRDHLHIDIGPWRYCGI